MAEETKAGDKSVMFAMVQQWVPPAMTALLGLLTGVVVAAYNFDLTTNRFFLEKQAQTADNIALQFSRYVENWARLVRMRRQIDAMKEEPSPELKAYFTNIVRERSDARDKLFSSLDSAHLYYDKDVSDLIEQFRAWDDMYADKTVDQLPDVEQWRRWQIDILRRLTKEVKK